MSNQTEIILSKGGSEERIVPLSQINIPDLWHIVTALRQNGQVADGPGCANLILKCWNRCHDLKNHIESQLD